MHDENKRARGLIKKHKLPEPPDDIIVSIRFRMDTGDWWLLIGYQWYWCHPEHSSKEWKPSLHGPN